MPTRPSRLRLLAAIVTSATATLLLLRVLQVGAEEPRAADPPADKAPVVAATRNAENPPAPPRDLVLPQATPSKETPPPKKPKRKPLAKRLMPVEDFGGY